MIKSSDAAAKMEELCRLKVASKRQVTLHFGEGDEIRLEVTDGQITKAEACAAVPTRLFTPDVLEGIANLNKSLAVEEDSSSG
jgi:hypothetical protein